MCKLPGQVSAGGATLKDIMRTSIQQLIGRVASLVLCASAFAASGAQAATYSVQMSRSGTGTGTIATSPAGIDCGSTCSANFTQNSTLRVTATAAAGSTFSGWTGACAGQANTFSASLLGSASCGAVFTASAVTPPKVTLSVGKAGAGSGTVTSSPAGIACGSTCSSSVSQNTSVTLTAAAASGSTFSGWSGSCAGTSANTQIVVSSNASCTATFATAIAPPPTQVSLAVARAGNGSGTVTSSPAGISCGTSCSANYNTGLSVTLTAAPVSGSTFTGWTGNCAGTASAAQVVLSVASTCTATFASGTTPPPVAGAPVVLYTDIASGPNQGGENNQGVYLSVFGKNFGTAGLGSTVKVYVNNVEVNNYRYLGESSGRADIQQVTVQIGALGNPAPGVALPVKVVVNGVASNTNQTFTVLPGTIWFVDNVKGVDTTTTTTGGTFAAPFKSVQKSAGAVLGFQIAPASTTGAWGRVRAGDMIVMRGTGTPYTDVGFSGYFLQALNKAGCAINTNCSQGGGTSSGPITIMGYPGEDVFINNAYNSSNDTGAFSSADSSRIAQGFGSYLTFVGLRVESGNHDGAMSTQAGGSNWRVVNNDLAGATAVKNSTAKGGGISGYGSNNYFVGNLIHDVYNGADNANSNFENHGIYLDGGSGYEIAYNHFNAIRGGNGISMYSTLGPIDNVNLHHNVFHNIGKHGINVADNSRTNIKVWDNVVYDTDRAGIRFNSSLLSGVKVYNNTFYNTNRINNAATGAMMNDATGTFDIRNNIFYPVNGAYDGGSFSGTISNNLFYGGSSSNPANSYSKTSVSTNPMAIYASAYPSDIFMISI